MNKKSKAYRIISLILVIILLLAVLVFRIVMTSPAFLDKRADSEDRRAEIWIQEITDLFAAENMIRKNGESPLQYPPSLRLLRSPPQWQTGPHR